MMGANGTAVVAALITLALTRTGRMMRAEGIWIFMRRCSGTALVAGICVLSGVMHACAQAPNGRPFPLSRLVPVGQPAGCDPVRRGQVSATAPFGSRYATAMGRPPAPAITGPRGGNGQQPTERLQPQPSSNAADARPETLQDAWQVALAVDQQQWAVAERVGAAESRVRGAETERYPLAAWTGQYTLRDNEPAYLIDAPGLPQTLNTPYLQSEDFAFQGRIDLPVYSGGRVSSQIAAAQSRLRHSRKQLARYRLDLKMRVAGDYVAVLRAEQELLVAESHQLSLASHARDTQMFHEQQRAPPNDLLAAQVALADAQHRVIRARSDLDAARATYNRNLGRPLTSVVNLTPLRVGAEPHDLDQLTHDALAQRPELSELDARIEEHRQRAEMALADNRAQVDLQGAYTFRENRFQSPNGISSAGIAVSWDLFDGGRARSRAQEHPQQARALAHQRSDLASQIQLQVRRAWLRVNETHQRLKVTRQAIARSEENLRVTRQRYGSGMSTNTDVLAAESLRVQTYRNHHNTVHDAVLAELTLRRATAQL